MSILLLPIVESSKGPLLSGSVPRGVSKGSSFLEKQQCRRAFTQRFGGTVQTILLALLLALLDADVKRRFARSFSDRSHQELSSFFGSSDGGGNSSAAEADPSGSEFEQRFSSAIASRSDSTLNTASQPARTIDNSISASVAFRKR